MTSIGDVAMVGPFGVRSRAPMDPTLIAQLDTVAAYEIKTSNVTLYLVECSRCGRRLDYHSRLLAVEVLRRHAAFCERPTSR